MSKLHIIAVQLHNRVGCIEQCANNIIAQAQEYHRTHAPDLLLYPELTLTGYPPEDLLFRKDFLHTAHQALLRIAKQAPPEMHLLVGCPLKTGEEQHLYNVAAVIHNGRLLHTYAKMCLPNREVFDEPRYFYPGQNPVVFTLNGMRIGLLICEDLWSQAVMDRYRSLDVDCFLVQNASPYTQHKQAARHRVLADRAKQYHAIIVYLNWVGGQDELIFDGRSSVYDASGKIIQQAAAFSTDILDIKCETRGANAKWYFQHARKPVVHQDPEITYLYQALVMGLKDYAEKNHFAQALLGLSGGIDSALTLAIACDAFGPAHVKAFYLPSRYSSAESLRYVQAQGELLQITIPSISIEPIFQASLHAITDIPIASSCKGLAEENLQARCRALLLMAISNRSNALLLTTGNKSEYAVGYATLYGDMAGGFAVLKDIYKTTVYELCAYRNQISYVIPNVIIQRPPSAELRENQLDTDTLPPYPVLDDILRKFLDQGLSIEEIVSTGHLQPMVEQVIRMVFKSEYKRRQAPPGLQLSHSAFGKMRRYPMTSDYLDKAVHEASRDNTA